MKKDLVKFSRNKSVARLFARQLPNGEVYISLNNPTKKDVKLLQDWLKKASKKIKK